MRFITHPKQSKEILNFSSDHSIEIKMRELGHINMQIYCTIVYLIITSIIIAC